MPFTFRNAQRAELADRDFGDSGANWKIANKLKKLEIDNVTANLSLIEEDVSPTATRQDED